MTGTSPSQRRNPSPDLVDLPFGIRVALKRIVADLRDIPRDVIFDRAELVHWVNRMAKRVEGIERTKVPVERPVWNTPKPAPSKPIQLSEAEKVFGQVAASPNRRRSRTVTSRKGKSVKVEIRSAQLPLFGAQT